MTRNKNKWQILIWVVLAVFVLNACSPAVADTTSVENTSATEESDQETTDGSEGTGDSIAPPPDDGQGGPPPGDGQQGNPPGNPPGKPPDNPPGNAPASPNAGSSEVSYYGKYILDGGTDHQSGGSYDASETDQSSIYVLNGGKLTLKNANITSSGDSTSSDNSSFYGLNAGVLATSGSSIDLSSSTVMTTGDGANGVFATGTGSTVTISDTTIDCTGQYAHAVMATLGGTLIVTNVDMNTAGASSGAIATDRGSGIITVTGGTVNTSGANSPGIYSTGVITVTDAIITATGSEAAVIEGANSITLNNTDLSSTYADKWGVMIYQSMSGDAEGATGSFTMTGGSLVYTSASGPLFYITNSTGIINLHDVDVTAASGILIEAAAGRWGNSGSNGGAVIFTTDQQTLSGDMLADSISSLAITLQNGSSLTGAINADQNAQSASLTLDASSTWVVTADSHLTVLENTAGISGTSISNIIGNGHTVTYDADANPSLGGKTYSLSGGGTLKPAG